MAFEIEYFHERVLAEIESWPVDVSGRLCITYAVATEVFRADDAKTRAAVYFTYTRLGPTKSAARKAPSLRVAPETGAGGVTRLVDIRDIDCASRLAIARFRLQRDPCSLCRVSLALPAICRTARRCHQAGDCARTPCRTVIFACAPSGNRENMSLAASRHGGD
jgi:hypothetical protein